MSGKIVKVCKVHGELTEDRVYFRNDGHLECRACKNESQRRWYEKNKARCSEDSRRYREKNKGSCNESKRRWSEKNKDKVIKACKRSRNKGSENMSDNYIKRLISSKSNLKFADITSEMIESKRLSIKAYRLYKQHLKEMKNGSIKY